MEELKQKIHSILQELNQYIPVQELTHAANEICTKAVEEDGTLDEDVFQEIHSYLMKPDKEFIPGQTANTKAITNNAVTTAFHKMRAEIKDYAAKTAQASQGQEEQEEQNEV